MKISDTGMLMCVSAVVIFLAVTLLSVADDARRLKAELANARTALDLATQATREHRKDCPGWQSGLCVPTALWFNYVASVQPK
jgi:hypothetical protein